MCHAPNTGLGKIILVFQAYLRNQLLLRHSSTTESGVVRQKRTGDKQEGWTNYNSVICSLLFFWMSFVKHFSSFHCDFHIFMAFYFLTSKNCEILWSLSWIVWATSSCLLVPVWNFKQTWQETTDTFLLPSGLPHLFLRWSAQQLQLTTPM